MSTLPEALAEAVSLIIGRETALGVAPTSGFQLIQPNADGIGNFYLHIKTVARSPLSKNRQMEAPEIVDADANPTINHDLTKDIVDATIEGCFLSRTKHAGGTGLAYFTPTARTTTDYTVAALGALPAGTLVRARGFSNAANNGELLVVGASSTATAIKVSGGIAETVSGYLATLEVAGFRGASGDIGLDVNGNLTSTVLDFTTLGLLPGMEIWVGGTIGGGHDFATLANRGFAEVAIAPTANLLTLKRRAWTVGVADAGAGKTIDLYFGRWLRNGTFGSADYLAQSYVLELTLDDLSGGTTDEFMVSYGNMVDQWQVNIPAAGLVTTSYSFVGTTITNPSTSRITGPSTAFNPLAISALNSVSKLLYERLVVAATEALVSDDIENAAITQMNHITPQKQHGTLGTKRDIVGKAEVSVDLGVFLTQDDALTACRANTTLAYGVGMRNDDFGIFFNVPNLKCTDSPPKFPGNGPVTLDLKLGAFRDPTLNYTMGATLFPYIPVA